MTKKEQTLIYDIASNIMDAYARSNQCIMHSRAVGMAYRYLHEIDEEAKHNDELECTHELLHGVTEPHIRKNMLDNLTTAILTHNLA